MTIEEDLFAKLDDPDLDALDRSRAVEFLATVETPKARFYVCRALASPEPLVREAAAIAAVAHTDIYVFDALMKRLESEEETGSVKKTVIETLNAWQEADMEAYERLEDIRHQISRGTNQVELVEYSGDDLGHALSAWTSTSRDLTDDKKARVPKLLAQLARDGHHTPFEKSYIRFLVTTDMATHIHILKHRIGVSVNAESARYKELKDDKFYVPCDFPDVEELEAYINHLTLALGKYHSTLNRLVAKGVSRKRAKELARFYIPYGNQIVSDVSFNFRSLMHFQGLRNTEHAQKEVRDLSKMMLRAVHNTGNYNASLEAFGWTKEKIDG